MLIALYRNSSIITIYESNLVEDEYRVAKK